MVVGHWQHAAKTRRLHRGSSPTVMEGLPYSAEQSNEYKQTGSSLSTAKPSITVGLLPGTDVLLRERVEQQREELTLQFVPNRDGRDTFKQWLI